LNRQDMLFCFSGSTKSILSVSINPGMNGKECELEIAIPLRITLYFPNIMQPDGIRVFL
jgi:hypothetical protein